MILEHLEEIQKRLEIAWGKMEYDRFRLTGVPLRQLDLKIKDDLMREFGEEQFSLLESEFPDNLDSQQREILSVLLGTRIQNEIYRHILVTVISELWVEYLTRVDALRVSIGLEAFAQRDPLVQYKGQAAEMFGTLLSDIRVGVISRMFRFQPRRAGAGAPEKQVAQASVQPSDSDNTAMIEPKKKRKRH
ncbi:MAG: hypothetical protein NTZ74_16760 [Chloroflexi bacterium]|nr:hypothetical protein [Chloroflexota bacterium]